MKEQIIFIKKYLYHSEKWLIWVMCINSNDSPTHRRILNFEKISFQASRLIGQKHSKTGWRLCPEKPEAEKEHKKSADDASVSREPAGRRLL